MLEKIEDEELETRPTLITSKSQSAQRNLESRFRGDKSLPRLFWYQFLYATPIIIDFEEVNPIWVYKLRDEIY